MWFLFLFLLGLCVGSFLNVVIERLPQGRGVVGGRSHCPKCGHALAWRDLVPLLSFVVLRSRCRYCQQKISWQYPLVEFATGAVFALSTINRSVGSPLADNQQSTIPFILYSLFLIPLFVTDLKHGIIPDKIVYPAIALVTSYRLLVTGSSELRPLFWTLLGSLVLYFAFCILHFAFRGRALGGGDVKLAFLVGLVAGFPNMIVAVFSAFLTGALASVILILLGKKKFGETVPFGPFLVVGTYIALLFGKDVLRWYLGFL